MVNITLFLLITAIIVEQGFLIMDIKNIHKLNFDHSKAIIENAIELNKGTEDIKEIKKEIENILKEKKEKKEEIKKEEEDDENIKQFDLFNEWLNGSMEE